MIKDLINNYVKDCPEYKVGLTMDDVREDYVLAEFRDEICKVNENENLLGVSPKAQEAMRRAAGACNYYPEGTGKALRAKLSGRYGLTPYNYMITEGASVALNLIGEVFLRPGDEVLIPRQTYGAYRNVAMRYQGVPVFVPMKEDKGIDLEALLKAIRPKTKLIFLCNPNNPTGMSCGDGELLAFLREVPEDVVVAVDEAYFQFIGKNGYQTALNAISEDRCHTIVVRTFSKVYGMAGARVGYIVSSLEIIRYMSRIVNYFCTNKIALDGALAALDDADFEEYTLRTVAEQKKYMTREFEAMGWHVCPSDTNFIFVDFGVPPKELCEKLQKSGIIARGDFDFTRISTGTPEQSRRIVETVKRLLKP